MAQELNVEDSIQEILRDDYETYDDIAEMLPYYLEESAYDEA